MDLFAGFLVQGDQFAVGDAADEVVTGAGGLKLVVDQLQLDEVGDDFVADRGQRGLPPFTVGAERGWHLVEGDDPGVELGEDFVDGGADVCGGGCTGVFHHPINDFVEVPVVVQFGFGGGPQVGA